MDFISTYIQPIGVALAVALSVWNLIQSPSTKNAGDIEKVRGEIKAVDDKADKVGGRVSTLETVLKHMPDQASMHRLEISLERMSGQIDTLNAKLQPVENLSRRLQEFMLEGKK